MKTKDMFDRRLLARKRVGKAFWAMCLVANLVGIVVLVTLLVDVLADGVGWLDWQFLSSFPSRFPEQAGIKSALWGTLWLVGLTALFCLPLGVGAAIYLEEYAPRNWLTQVIQTNIYNLAGVPSIVYGILGLALFVRALALQRSVISGALTMSLLALPIVIIATQEAIRAVPGELRQAAYALGSTRWQTIRYIVLPVAFPGILTGIILTMSQVIGETAPLVMIGALTFIAFIPSSPLDPFTVLPIQIFNWASRPQKDFHDIAAAAIVILLVILLTMNTAAILLRNKYQKRSQL
jgi:phosphate transport system permease protein